MSSQKRFDKTNHSKKDSRHQPSTVVVITTTLTKQIIKMNSEYNNKISIPPVVTTSARTKDDDETALTTTTSTSTKECKINSNINNNNTHSSDDLGNSNIKICNVNDYQNLSKQILTKAIYEYVASGTDDEQTIQENRSAYKSWYLRPRVCNQSLTNIDTTTTIRFGSSTWNGTGTPTNKNNIWNQIYDMPLFISPAGLHGVVNEQIDGECATARACIKHNILFSLSQHSTRTIEEIGTLYQKQQQQQHKQCSNYDTQARWWYQAYILKDRSITYDLIQRAINMGCSGVYITVDSIKFGYREADDRNNFDSLRPPHRLVNYDQYSMDDTTTPSTTAADTTAAGLDATYNGQKYQSWDQNTELLFDANVTWETINEIKQQIVVPNQLPLIVKGIMTPEDAIAAITLGGADAIMVSNHGGRQLDGCLATIDVLPSIVQAVRCVPSLAHIPIFLDGGIRRGTDIMKALALGANAVGIGKPLFFALSCHGQVGVENMIQLFKKELIAAMALTGCASIRDIIMPMPTTTTTSTTTVNGKTNYYNDQLVTRHPYGAGHSPPNYIRSAL